MASVRDVMKGVNTLITLIGSADSFTKILRSVVNGSDPVGQEISNMANHFEMTSSSINVGFQQLKGHCSTISNMKEVKSNVLDYINQKNLTDVWARCSESMIDQMETIGKDLLSKPGSPRFLKDLRWYLWEKMKVESLFTGMDRLRGYLSLIIPILQLEINQHRSAIYGPEIEQCLMMEMKSLREQLRVTERVCRRVLCTKSKVSDHEEASNVDYHEFAIPLLRLSRTMRKKGTVPVKRDSPRDDDSSRRRRPSSSLGDVVIPSIGRPSSTKQGSTRTKTPEPSVIIEPPGKYAIKLLVDPLAEISQIPEITKARRIRNGAKPRELVDERQTLFGGTKKLGKEKRELILDTLIDSSNPDSFVSIKAIKEFGFDIVKGGPIPPNVHCTDHGDEILGKVIAVSLQLTDSPNIVVLDLWVTKCYPRGGFQVALGRDFLDGLGRSGSGDLDKHDG